MGIKAKREVKSMAIYLFARLETVYMNGYQPIGYKYTIFFINTL